MNYKYTSDGKKVAVIGQLNANETIVQEIFISNNQEIPSGENFVVKSLHDEPVISWAEKHLKRIEDNTKRMQKEQDEEELKLRNKRKQVREIGSTLDDQIKWMKQFMTNVKEESFNLLNLFITAKVTHMVRLNYDLEIVEFEKFMSNEYGMKLLTMFGKDNGNLCFGVSRYSDGSGSWNDATVIPASSYDEALEIVQIKLTERIKESGKCGSYDIKSAEKYGLTISPEILMAYYEKEMEDEIKRHRQIMEDADKRSSSIDNIKIKLNSLKPKQ